MQQICMSRFLEDIKMLMSHISHSRNNTFEQSYKIKLSGNKSLLSFPGKKAWSCIRTNLNTLIQGCFVLHLVVIGPEVLKKIFN